MSFSLSNFRASNWMRKQPTFPQEEGTGMKRVLRWWDLLSFGIASTVGAGLFVTSGVALKKAGGGLIFSFLLSGIAALLSGLCYAEYAARIPLSGSAYTFIYVTLGELIGWLIGWNMTLEYAVSASAVAQGWAGYVVQMFNSTGVEVPWYIEGGALMYPFSWSPLGLLIIIVCTLILLMGMKESAILNMIMTIVNITVILFIIVLGAIHFDISNWDHFWDNADGTSALVGITSAAATVFFSFIGFDAVTTLAGEVKKPETDLPLSIVITLVIVTSLYIGVSIVLTGMVTFLTVNVKAPLSSAFSDLGLPWAGIIVSVASVTVLTTSTLTALVGQPRVFYQMAHDGLLFSQFSILNSKSVPIFGTIATAVLSGLLAFFFNLDALSDMISAGTLLAYGTVASGIIFMRYSPKEEELSETSALIREYPAYSRWSCCEDFGRFTNKKITLFLGLYCLGTIFLGVSARMDWPFWTYAPPAFVMLLVYLALQSLRQTNLPKSFKTPLVPLVPLLAISVNIFFITQLPLDALYRVIGWSFIGFLVYAFYGIHHSNLNLLSQDSSNRPRVTNKGSSQDDYNAMINSADDDGHYSDTVFDARPISKGQLPRDKQV